MRSLIRLCLLLTALTWRATALSQPPDRVPYNNQQLFLNGANLAWMSFSNDIGPGLTDTATFGEILLQIHDHGGNAVRWWLHIDGTNTPQFNETGLVTGPGVNAISNLRHSLDIAWQREVGVVLCLWSFDMLRTNLPSNVLNRNVLLLNDTNYIRAYINNSLIPMVDSLKGHPGILALEIFNEPEGMSNEFGWDGIQHVPMATIERFVNMCTGAIHRTDPNALVTSGAWSFMALTDVPLAAVQSKVHAAPPLSSAQQLAFATKLKAKYRLDMTPDEIIQHLEKVAFGPFGNYYSDSLLIAKGGDSLGTLDFYSVHYYYGINPSNPISISPFNHPASAWGLTKPIVAAEFAMADNSNLGMTKSGMFDTLYQLGYAGALPWSWTDVKFSTQPDMLAGMQYMWDHYRADVDVQGSGQYWPNVAITSPPNDTTFADSATIQIVAAVSDSGSRVTSVRFYADTLLLGEATSSPYTVTWVNPPAGNYVLKAVAVDSIGHYRTSGFVHITVGIPPMTHLEAELAAYSAPSGNSMTVKTDPTASGGKFLDMAAQNGKVTWHFTNVNASGSYPIAFGFKLAYATPKDQYVNVNGVRTDTVHFESTSTSTWLEKTITVDLVHGIDSIQMELYWGWMYLDYLAVPTNVLTSVTENTTGIPERFELEQNYPNPINPSTTIEYTVAGTRGQGSGVSEVRIVIYDVLGREVATLVNARQAPGTYRVRFDGSHLASGVYFYRLIAGSYAASKAMMLLK